MTASLLMLIGGIALVVGALVCILNGVCFIKSEGSNFGATALVHLLFGFVAWLGGLALVAGFIWFMVLVIVKEVKGAPQSEQQKVEVTH
jgi:hypothetical protein